MVKVLTSHSHIWHPERVAADIAAEYLSQGKVTVDLNSEGPCADSIGLYRLLDYVCSKFDIDRSRISIQTANFEEQHPQYQIVHRPQHWIASTVRAWRKHRELKPKTFECLFGCLYNVPSWDRLCLLSYIHRTSQNFNVLHCNGTWAPDRYNTYYLNNLVDHAPDELSAVISYLQTNPQPALSDVSDSKPVTAEHMLQVYTLYPDFFVDVVAETYNQGLSFFITEKTLRPILALTPFIVNAPQSYLSTLRSDYNIRTFDSWWSEDYDNYQGYQRIERMYRIIDQLDALEPSDWQSMYQDMLPTLEHNQQQILQHEQRRRISR